MFLQEARNATKNREPKYARHIEFINAFDCLDEHEQAVIDGIYRRILRLQNAGALMALEVTEKVVVKILMQYGDINLSPEQSLRTLFDNPAA